MTIDSTDSYLEESIDCDKQNSLEFSTGRVLKGVNTLLIVAPPFIQVLK